MQFRSTAVEWILPDDRRNQHPRHRQPQCCHRRQHHQHQHPPDQQRGPSSLRRLPGRDRFRNRHQRQRSQQQPCPHQGRRELLVLSHANTYTGQTNIVRGTVVLGDVHALGGAGSSLASDHGGTTVQSGAVLDLNGQTGIQEVITLSGSGINNNGAW
ncbi:hypothetical protein [Verrucomicrobium spinosum]|uniref:hypothetical protein n=1 Tax=Verrucomicrobium spinosum TaxID=2736 RepID=UPI003CCC918A